MSRIRDKFAELKSRGETALIAYLTAGDPSPDLTARLVWALERGGVDMIELGVPFSDPLADGPRIQLAMDRALKHHVNLPRVLDIAREIRTRSSIPLVLFSYLNPLLRYGFERCASEAAAAGIDGCLATDLTVEEAEDRVKALHSAGLETVFLAAPTSTLRRLELVSRYSTGFIYLVSRTGVTGEQEALSQSVARMVSALKDVTDKPLAVGFGISRPEQAAAVGRMADAVVVGSAFVRVIEEYAQAPDLEARIEDLARRLKEPLRASQ
ncbi:MAG: tryptophan synthase subunit alpha [Acidobacteria bacterium]|nr:tryptophan synthase subunit alpha [Acidobacteriota bacterium]